jgi:small subunit ribosomal protein S15
VSEMHKDSVQVVNTDKSAVVDGLRHHALDTGSSEVQIALLTQRIEALNAHHFSQHKKDFAGKRGLLRLVNQRRKLLKYLELHNPAKRLEILERLGIRK